MKTYLISSFLIIYTFVNLSNAAQQRNILWNEYQNKSKSLNDVNVWRTQLIKEVNNNLNKIPEKIKQELIANADNASNPNWPSLLAMDLLEYVINGNRMHFEGFRSDRDKKLGNLIIGELLTQKGKYMNQIANGVWLILEESTWIWPAHLGLQKAGVGLPDPAQFVIDLGVGESASRMAWIKLLMGEKLAKINQMIPKRIDYELNRRIIRPFLDQSFGWMGFNGNKVNNWNIWINANVLMTTLLAVDNQTLREQLIARAVHSGDKWVNGYGNDGGCDEGPNYWRQAAGRFIEFLNFISSASGNQINFSSYTLIRSIGEYMFKMHIDRDRFVNFADASGKIVPDSALILKYGTLFNDQKMKEFASYFYEMSGGEKRIIESAGSGDLNHFINEISAHELIKTIPPKAPHLAESWFPDLQVITLRSEEGTAKGLFLGAKAGTNDESHNHNDVGNFVLYVDGMPAIIDVGVGTYTAQTFSKDRYKLWYMQSQWHNTPTINGVQQHDGPAFVSHNVKYTKLTNGGEFEADIAGAYPKEAEVKSWVRKFTFDRKTNTIELKESYVLNKLIKPLKVHFITVLNETQSSNGSIELKDKNVKLHMHYNSSVFDVEVEQHKVIDSQLTHVWGDHVNRVSLVSKDNSLHGDFTTTFKLS